MAWATRVLFSMSRHPSGRIVGGNLIGCATSSVKWNAGVSRAGCLLSRLRRKENHRREMYSKLPEKKKTCLRGAEQGLAKQEDSGKSRG